MEIKFQADNDFSERILRGVKRREPTIDFLTAHEGEIADLEDPKVLAKAADSGRLLVTHDRRTMPYHFADFVAVRESPGVVIVPQSMSIGEAVEGIILIWAASSSREWVNRIQVIP